VIKEKSFDTYSKAFDEFICARGFDLDSTVDKRGVLDDEIFTYRISKEEKVFISYEGKQVTTLSGSKAKKFISDIEGSFGKDAQLIMAKVTGNFKRGNEKLSKPRM
jgi:hypothetical protein